MRKNNYSSNAIILVNFWRRIIYVVFSYSTFSYIEKDSLKNNAFSDFTATNTDFDIAKKESDNFSSKLISIYAQYQEAIDNNQRFGQKLNEVQEQITQLKSISSLSKQDEEDIQLAIQKYNDLLQNLGDNNKVLNSFRNELEALIEKWRQEFGKSLKKIAQNLQDFLKKQDIAADFDPAELNEALERHQIEQKLKEILGNDFNFSLAGESTFNAKILLISLHAYQRNNSNMADIKNVLKKLKKFATKQGKIIASISSDFKKEVEKIPKFTKLDVPQNLNILSQHQDRLIKDSLLNQQKEEAKLINIDVSSTPTDTNPPSIETPE